MEKLANISMDYLLAALAVCFVAGLIAFIIAAGVLAGALKNIKSLFEKQAETQHIGPQPFEVREHVAFATEAELKRVEGKVEAVDHDLKAFRKEVVTNGEHRRDFITAHVSEQTRFLQKQINDLPGSIIATLRNAGHIK